MPLILLLLLLLLVLLLLSVTRVRASALANAQSHPRVAHVADANIARMHARAAQCIRVHDVAECAYAHALNE